MRLRNIKEADVYANGIIADDRANRPRSDQVEACRKWINAHAAQVRRINPRLGTSYHLKHVVEKTVDKYVSNGAFIVAALQLGYRVLQVEDGSPNVFFNMKMMIGILEEE